MTGVVFSGSRNTNEAPAFWEKSDPSSAKGSPAVSISDAEKAESTLEDDEKALARYIVPALEKGIKTPRLSQSRWIKFRVWYNPYRIVR